MRWRRFTECSAAERARLVPLLTPRWNAFIAHAPHPRQHAALLLNERRELLFGGAAGGGKSDYLLMAALQYVDVPGYAALLLRRTFAQLSKAGGLLLRAQEWLAGKARGVDTVNGAPTRWLFPSGARLEFGHCQLEHDKYDYQSAAYQFVGFDELTQFTEGIYTYVGHSRLRRLEGQPVPLRVRAASNPGGDGHAWVKQRFLDERHPQRAFLRSLLQDNPSLDRAAYVETLSELHPYERAQLLDGDWDAKPPGRKFQRAWFQIVPAAPAVGRYRRRVRYWDLAGTRKTKTNEPCWTVGTRMGQLDTGELVIDDVRRFRKSPHGVDRELEQTAALDGSEVPIWIEQEPGSAGKFTIQHFVDLLVGYAVRPERPTGDKLLRMDPLASQAEAGNVLLVNGPWVKDWLEEVEQVPDGTFLDQPDSASGALKQLRAPGLDAAGLYGERGDEAEEKAVRAELAALEREEAALRKTEVAEVRT